MYKIVTFRAVVTDVLEMLQETWLTKSVETVGYRCRLYEIPVKDLLKKDFTQSLIHEHQMSSTAKELAKKLDTAKNVTSRMQGIDCG